MGRRRNLLKGTQGPYEGYQYYRVESCRIDGVPYGEYYFMIYDLYLYQQYDQGGTAIPAVALTSDTSNPTFQVSASSVDGTSNAWKGFDQNTGTFWRGASWQSAYYLDIELDRPRLFKSWTIKAGAYRYYSTYIKLMGSTTGAFAGEEDLLDITPVMPGNGWTTHWNFLTTEYPTRAGAISLDSSTTTSLTCSIIAATATSPATIASYDWYVGGVYDSNTTGLIQTFSGLDSNSTYDINVVAIDSVGLRSNPNDVVSFDTAAVGITHHSGTGAGTYNFFRFVNTDSAGDNILSMTAIKTIKLFTATGQEGTDNPTSALSSPTSMTGVTVTVGYEANTGSYAGFRAFDNAANWWWTISIANASDNWLVIEFDTAVNLASLYIDYADIYQSADGIKVEGSNTGAFAGEEDVLCRFSNITEGNSATKNIIQNDI